MTGIGWRETCSLFCGVRPLGCSRIGPGIGRQASSHLLTTRVKTNDACDVIILDCGEMKFIRRLRVFPMGWVEAVFLAFTEGID